MGAFASSILSRIIKFQDSGRAEMSWMALRPRKEIIMDVKKWVRPTGNFDAVMGGGRSLVLALYSTESCHGSLPTVPIVAWYMSQKV